MHYEIRLKEARSRAGIDRAVLGGQIVTHSMNAAPAPMAAESPLYQMPSRSISHEQKIQPVATGPVRPFTGGTAYVGYESASISRKGCELPGFRPNGAMPDFVDLG